ncbi:LCP family protein [Bacillus sp. CECT 9360]|uniref:LCP family protein n=1 Tax=Bacillus sp. CECT 9360 TaxID=2845821 RepID=UPI001E44D197|nr:LCP family protein [Bacillus sp. CECT 9360]CAH0344864.1 Polyisoprenyl-teichoic acid--peptidoglycan teichoic acid transferase TagU [Bacillus sp. CECT 9360]
MVKTRIVRTKKRKKKKKLRKFLLLVLLTIIGVGGYWGYDVISSSRLASDKIYEQYLPDHRDEDVKISKEPFSILLAGIENQDGGEGRADVLMLITINPKTKQIFMLSIPRDSRVYVPEKGYNTKINHTYGYKGGIRSTISITEDLMDVPIDYYVTTNFDGFEDIVDSLGGIEVNVPFTFTGVLTGSHKFKTFNKGPMELNGNEALAYVRMRKNDPNNDKGRNERQKQVIKAIISKGTSFSSLVKVDDVMNDLGENVKTNIRPSKMLQFARLYKKIEGGQIQDLNLEGENQTINGAAYFIPYESSIEESSKIMKRSLRGEKVDINSEASE